MEVPRLAPSAGGQRADAELLERMLESRRKHPKAPAVPQKPQKRHNEDWEAIGLAGIKKKGLHLDVSWGEQTWNNKASIWERLKLLKDDGVDVTDLENPKKGGSMAITKALVAQIAARKQQPQKLQEAVEDASSSSESTEVTQELPFDPLFDEPEPLSSLKRKRDDTLERASADPEASNAGDNVEESGPSFKKFCIDSLREVQQATKTKIEEIPTWDELKRHVLTEVFQPSRTARPLRSTPPPSRISITFPSRSDKEAGPHDLQLSSSGYECIMDELRVLSNSTDKDGTFHLLEPEAIDGNAIVVHHTCGAFRNIPLRTVIEGDLVALMGLLSRLSAKGIGLTYMEKRHFDVETGERKWVNAPQELSDKTQLQLTAVKDALEAGLEAGSMEVGVSCVTPAGQMFGRKG